MVIPQENKWSFSKKFVFLFGAILLGLNTFPTNLLLSSWDEGLVNFFASAIFGLKTPLNTDGMGSGDTAFEYVQVFVTFAATILIVPVLLILLRRKNNFEKLAYWTFLCFRYYLASTMFLYGFGKVFKIQFQALGLENLLQPYGNSSPMRLAWSFMGHSDLYCIFAGLAEVIAGFLLLFKRTAMLGAILTAAVMFNVMMMNYGFDIPVKLFSTQLVLTSLFVLLPYGSKVINFFFLHKDHPSLNEWTPSFGKVGKIVQLVIQTIIGGGVLLASLLQCMFVYGEYGEGVPKPALYGVYHVSSFIKNGSVVPPLATDTTRWKTLVLSRQGFASVRFYNDSIRYLGYEVDTVLKKIEIRMREAERQATVQKAEKEKAKGSWLNYELKGAEFILKGIYNKDSIHVTFRRMKDSDFLLVKRGFHWINEFPFNR